MSRKLFINVTPAEVRAAWTEESVLIDLMVDRGDRASVIGNIYLGRVERVMRGMEAAFVNVGFQRSGFLGLDGGRRRNGNTGPPVHEGEAVVVQVTKDAIASKGVQLTRRVTLPGRFLVYAPFQDRVMISRRIEVVNERERLAGLMAKLALDGEGFVVRTASVGASKKELETDCNQLREAWATIEKAEINGSVPSCLHAEIDPVLRVLRDHVQSDIDIIYVDNAAAAEAAQKFCEKTMPGIAHKVQLFTGEKQMFEQYGIEEEIEHAFTSRVGLRSGGSLVIQT
ncbi:MAG: ribonuclease E/G, partial [Pseudomonadota bacterium]|nr:ribonuclease E/G [Pseudomonadota bacterium]